MDFGDALRAMRDKKKVARLGWNGRGMYLFLHDPGIDNTTEPSNLPYIVMKTADGNRVPWLASQSDLICGDWIVVD